MDEGDQAILVLGPTGHVEATRREEAPARSSSVAEKARNGVLEVFSLLGYSTVPVPTRTNPAGVSAKRSVKIGRG